ISLPLSDSLHLLLDEEYQLALTPKLSARQLKRREDDDDYEVKRLSHGFFRYEYYNLKSLRLNARVDHTANSPGEPVSLYIKAIDENDLPAYDARVSIIVRSNYKKAF